EKRSDRPWRRSREPPRRGKRLETQSEYESSPWSRNRLRSSAQTRCTRERQRATASGLVIAGLRDDRSEPWPALRVEAEVATLPYFALALVLPLSLELLPLGEASFDFLLESTISRLVVLAPRE